MIIDAHAHVYADPKIKPSPGATTYMSVEQQLDVMDRMGIDVSVILMLNGPECTGEPQSVFEIQHICNKYPNRFIPFCCIDPRLQNQPKPVTSERFEFILNQYKQLGYKGIGEMTARVYWDDPALMRLFEAAEKVGFPVTFHTTVADSNDYGLIDELGFPRFEKVLQSFPNLVFLAHSQAWWAEMSGDIKLEEKTGYPKSKVVPGGAVHRLMRKYPQIYGDLSANSGYNSLARDPEHAYKFIDEFQDRLCFGQDFCSVKNERKLLDWLKTALAEGRISKDAYEKITYENIAKILKLDIT
jgi:predicted TIM-barrel fold metal-dependent hydrolase